MVKKIYIYKSDSFCPYENLAIEKYLFENIESESAILYLWQNDNTVVIGRNQNLFSECKISVLKEQNIKIARRESGGGTVFHDLGNLNFTFIGETKDFDIKRNMEIIKNACLKVGVQAQISGRNDITVNDKKFSGNAFLNAGGKSYQHGTILINADFTKMQSILTPPKLKLQSKGVKSVRSRVINLSEISKELTCDLYKEYLIEAFQDEYSIDASYFDIKNQETINSYKQKFSDIDYIYGSPIPFSISISDRFNWGTIQIDAEIKSSVINTIKVYTDSLDWMLSQKVESALTNTKFDIKSIETSLLKEFDNQLVEDILNLIKKAF